MKRTAIVLGVVLFVVGLLAPLAIGGQVPAGWVQIQDANGSTFDVALPYQVGPGTAPPATTTTTIPTPTGKTVRIALVGDVGANVDAKAGLDAVEADDINVLLVSGDLSYDEATEPVWCNMMAARLPTTRLLLQGGNHEDDDGPHGHINTFVQQCITAGVSGDAGVNWHKDLGPVTVIGIAADLTVNGKKWTYAPGTQERNQLQNRIANARAEGDWVMVSLHKLCWNVHTNKSCEIGVELAQFLETNVDVIAHGHEHIYQRSHPRPGVWVGSGIFGTRDATCAGSTHVGRTGADVAKFATSMCEGDVGWGHGYAKVTFTDTQIVGEWVNWQNPGGYTDSWVINR